MNYRKLISIAFISIFSLVEAVCTKAPPTAPELPPLATKAIYVVNEGNFGRNNSTLSYYIPDSNRVYQDVFAAVNGRNLGDTGNDMVLYKDRGYIVVNNSQKIEVITLVDNKSVGTIVIPAIPVSKSPYRLTILSDTKAYVTNLYDNSVTVFNPTTLAITKDRIPVGNNPQGIAVVNNKVYVCNSGFGLDSTVSVIDPFTDAVIKTIVVGKSPSDIGVDVDGELIVKCDGFSDFVNPNNDTPGSIVVINPLIDAVTATIPLPLATYGHPGRLAVSLTGIGYAIVKGGVMKFGTKTRTVLSNPFVTGSFYSLAVDDVTERVYVTNAKDYIQPGEVIIYDKNAFQVGRFDTGIIPGTIAFKR